MQHQAPSDKSSRHGVGKNTTETPEPLIPDVEEESPCPLLLREPDIENGDLVEVAFGHVQPPNEEQVTHFLPLEGGHFRVFIDSIVCGNENVTFPLPRPERGVNTLSEAQGSFVAWPRGWVRFLEEIWNKLEKAPPKVAKGHKNELKKER